MSPDFSDYDIEDFAFDQSFQDWVLGNESAPRGFWEQYLEDYPHQTDKVLAARQLVLDLKATQQPPADTDLATSIWQDIQRRIQPGGRQVRWVPTLLRAAAVVVAALGMGYLAWNREAAVSGDVASTALQTEAGERMLEEYNPTDKVVKLHLSDGSVVSLAKDSRLTYPEAFGASSRVVSLHGEAFFDVRKNTDKPFLVYANGTVTKVLGTSFRVLAYDDAPDVTVKVKTGRVSVFVKKDFEAEPAKAQRTGVVLTPNQQAVFLKEQIQLTKTLVEAPDLLVPPDRKPSFRFDNTPLRKVFDVLERAYGVEIVADPDLTAGRALTVSMEDESLYEKLDVICLTLGLSYQIVDAKVLVEAKKKT